MEGSMQVVCLHDKQEIWKFLKTNTFRGQNLATQVNAKLCASLLRTIDSIGLNVHTEDSSAIACYSNLGFERVAVYEEFMCMVK